MQLRISVHTRDSERWITLNGGEGKGTHVKVDGSGNVVAGLGGKQLTSRKSSPKEEAHQPGKTKGFGFRGGLSEEHSEAIKEYASGLYASKTGGYTNLQAMLRTGSPEYKQAWDPEEGPRQLEHLKEAFRRASITEPMVTYRGLRLERSKAQQLLALKPGDSFEDPGVTSSSTKKAVATKFSERLNRSDVPVQMELRLPAGTKAINVPDITGSNHEGEVAVAPGTKFRLLKRTESGGAIKMILEALPT